MKILALLLIFAISYIYASFAQQDSCDYKVEILVDGSDFEKENFKWRMIATKIEGKSTNITGRAEMQADGKTIKSYKPWTSASISKQKTSSQYSPNLNPGRYQIKAEINVECEDTNKDNNVDIKIIKITEEKEEVQNKRIQIENTKIADNKTDPPELISIQNTKNITATQTQKLTASEEAENIIQLKNNKNQQLPLTANAIKNSSIAYESSNEKAKGLIVVSLLALSILLNIILIWKR